MAGIHVLSLESGLWLTYETTNWQDINTMKKGTSQQGKAGREATWEELKERQQVVTKSLTFEAIKPAWVV